MKPQRVGMAKVLDAIRAGNETTTDVARALGCTQNTASVHALRLEVAGVIRCFRIGKHGAKCYRVIEGARLAPTPPSGPRPLPTFSALLDAMPITAPQVAGQVRRIDRGWGAEA